MKFLLLVIISLILFSGIKGISAEEIPEDAPKVDIDLGESREGSRTDAEGFVREGESESSEGFSTAQLKDFEAKHEKTDFKAEVNRMMKLIINSLYRNKEIFLRELISNASDALDKIRLLLLTDSKYDSYQELAIRIKADKVNNALHIIDTGIGMTREELKNNLGTIARSGTADFLSKAQENKDSPELNDMIGQFGVGFYSAFLVAEKVVVTSKSEKDKQYVWVSNATSFNILEDPRGDTLKRGTIVSLYLKSEAKDYIEEDTVKQLITKYSQFINFPIYLWSSKTVEEEVPVELEEEKKTDENDVTEDDEVKVEEEKTTKKQKTEKVKRTVWDWQKLNDRSIWTKKPKEVTEEEYIEFYKKLSKDTSPPLTYTHFIAEGEVTFKSLLYVPKVQSSDSFNRYGTQSDNIKLYVRRVFITDEFKDIMPNYLNFIRGIVDSDDLPLNVSRETLQQHKLLKVIKKKLVRKVLDMLNKLDKKDYPAFWKEYSTNIKLGITEDPYNRSRLSKLLRFHSSHSKNVTSFAEYVERMKPKQDRIYYIAAADYQEAEKSPFIEESLKRGYEVLYLIEPIDEYCLSSLPEFNGYKFSNLAKEDYTSPDSEETKEAFEQYKKDFEPLTKWLGEKALKNKILKAEISQRLSNSPCALVAGMFGWTGNMERLALSNAHQKSDDPQRTYYLNQKKTLEINPRHPVIKELLKRVISDENDELATEMANVMFNTATLRSGYMLRETSEFAESVEKMMRQTLDIPLDEVPDEIDYVSSTKDDAEEDKSKSDKTHDETEESDELHDEL